MTGPARNQDLCLEKVSMSILIRKDMRRWMHLALEGSWAPLDLRDHAEPQDILLKKLRAKLHLSASELNSTQIANLTLLQTLASTWAQSKIQIHNQLHQYLRLRLFRSQVYSLFIQNKMHFPQDRQTHWTYPFHRLYNQVQQANKILWLLIPIYPLIDLQGTAISQ